MSEFKNPFTNARIVGDGVAAEVYIRQEPGVLRGHPNYVMGRSSLMECFTNPLRWVKGYEEQDTKSTEWGTLRDCLVLDRANFNKRFVVRPATYPAPPKHAKVKSGEINEGDPLPWHHAAGWCADWLEQHEGKNVVKPDDMDKNKIADEMLCLDIEIGKVLIGGKYQVLGVAEYKDPATGIVVPVKILIDIVPGLDGPYGDCLADFKTTVSADPQTWHKAVFKYQYHVQAAFYLDVYAAAMPKENRTLFYHVTQENVHPFVSERHGLDENFIALGRSTYQAALAKYVKCLHEGVWPGYPPKFGNLLIDGWHYAKPEDWMLG